MQPILDSHIHLWPSTSTSSQNHGWMTPTHFLAKRHGIIDYLSVTQPYQPAGFVYVETDRYLPSATPPIHAQDSSAEVRQKLETWAKEPLEELRFLRRIVEGKYDASDDGCENVQQASLMKGCVVWAPFHLSSEHFQSYLQLAEEVAGPRLWERVVGFRYLLQGKGQGVVGELVEREDWVENVCALGRGREGKGWAFDVGVDTHRDGIETLEQVVGMVERVRKKESASGGKPVRFIINHLAKPPLSNAPSPRWQNAMQSLSTDKNVYMKLSGAFNEFDSPTPADIPSLLTFLTPFLNHVFECFPQRVMFGSDWPVCNVGGPKGEKGNWMFWREVVEKYLEERGMGDGERESVWVRAGCEGYGVEM